MERIRRTSRPANFSRHLFTRGKYRSNAIQTDSSITCPFFFESSLACATHLAYANLGKMFGWTTTRSGGRATVQAGARADDRPRLAAPEGRGSCVVPHGPHAVPFLTATVANSKNHLTHRAKRRKRFSNRNKTGISGFSRIFRTALDKMPARCLWGIALLSLFAAYLPMHLGAATARAAQSAEGSSAASPELAQARSLLESGKAAEAASATREFLKSHPDSGEGHFLLGFILFREIQLQGADASTMSYPPRAREIQSREAKARESLAEFTEGARHKIPSAFDLKIVAFDYIFFNDYADADKWLTRSLQMNPSDADTWYTLGRTKYSENHFDEAIQAFERCLALDPKNVKAENNLGLSYEGLGKRTEAIAAYKQAISWQVEAPKKDHEPYLNLGSLLIDADQPKDALAYLLQANSIPPDDAKVHERLGKAYSHLNQLSQAQAEFEKAVALAPDVASLHFMLGQVYRREGMLEKANAEFKRTDELNGTHSSDAAPQP